MLIRALTKSLENLAKNRENTPCPKRRGFLKLTAASLGALVVPPALAKTLIRRERILTLYSPPTGELIRTTYWTPTDGYLPESIREISWALRDHYTDQVASYDPGLLDVMYFLQLSLDYQQPFHVICGYRSPGTNAMLRKKSKGVARNSYHMYGMAADIRMPGRNTWDLYRTALDLQAGGVGYYPRASFIHVDTGPLRSWGYRSHAGFD